MRERGRDRGHCTRHTNDEWDEARDCVYSWMVTKKVQYDFQWRIFNSPLPHSVTTIKRSFTFNLRKKKLLCANRNHTF